MFWYKIAATKEELFDKEGEIKEVHAGGKEVCVMQIKGKLHACAHKCPHAGAKMEMGYVDALGNIVCPLHRYKFSLLNGRNISGEGYFLKIYIIEEREDGIFIVVEEKKGLFE